MARLGAWWQAARPLAQFNIAMPLIVGQALAVATGVPFGALACVLVHVFGLCDHLFIVFANDVADEAGDRLNATHTIFSGGSRVLPDGKLLPSDLRRAASLMALGMLAICATSAFAFDRPTLLLGCGAAFVLLFAYSFPPLRLSYRGFGEIAQGLGIGAVLPAIGFVAQAGSLENLHAVQLVPLVVLGIASNITTALPDTPADREIGKLTWPVRVGPVSARKHSLLVIALGVLMTPLLLPSDTSESWLFACEAPSLVVLVVAAFTWRSADPQDRRGCGYFVFLGGLAVNLAMFAWTLALVFAP